MPEHTPAQPPIATKKPVTRSFHGRDFVDDYEWLRDKESPETIAYLEAENAYTDAQTAHLQDLAENIYDEITSRVKQTDMSIPVRAGDWWYYGRTEEGKDYGYSCRLPVEEGADPWTPPTIPEEGVPDGEQILLDLNELAEGHEFFSLGASTVTDSGRYLAYSIDTEGDERFDLFVKDLQSGELLDDRLTGVFYGATWVDEDYIFYQRVDEAWRPDSVWRHKIGTPESEDVLVYREEDERFTVGAGGTRSRKYLIIESASKITTETRVLETADPEGEFTVLWPREHGVEYSVDHAEVAGQDRWIVTHNATGENFAVGETGVEKLAPLRELNPLLPHDEQVRVEGVDTYQGHIVAAYRRGAIGRLAIMRLGADGYGSFEELDFDEELYTVGAGGQP
ncbi:MAG: oligopeptidase B, partial [Corynebacterium sp.]|nr:oligopeptidase B [Corynebacterium sp.]